MYSSYEQEIISNLSALQEKFALEKTEYRTVNWNDHFAIDQCYLRRDKVFLSAYVRVLTATELIPILASALAFHKLLWPRRKRLFLFFWKQIALLEFLVLGVPIILVVLNERFGNRSSETIVGYAILGIWGSSFLTYGARYTRRLRLMADSLAAKTLGKEVYLSSLAKLQSHQPENDQDYRHLSFFRRWPQIRERIQNLSR